jgi:hypothetical protein
MNKNILSLALAGACAIPAFASTTVDLYIYRVGSNSGTDTLANTGNEAWIDVWSTNGTTYSYKNSINTGIFASGTATSEGLINFNPANALQLNDPTGATYLDGKYLAFTGYKSKHTTSLANSTGSTINRSVGVLDITTNTITRTHFSDFSSGNNPRSAIPNDTGSKLWMDGGAGSARYATVNDGASNQTSIQLSTTTTNLRQIEIVRDSSLPPEQLYTTSASGSTRVATVGTGVPTTSGQTIANLPGINTTNTSTSPYGVFFADLSSTVAGVDTLYVADDSASGGIQKYTLTGSAWVLTGTVSATSVRGLTGYVDSDGVRLFGTTGGSTASGGGSGTVYSFLDTTGYNGTITGTASTLFTQAALQTALGGAGDHYAFRGPEVAIPEASTFALLAGLGALTVAFVRRKQS